MAWQAPTGPSYPGQPGSAYPGQPGAQFPGQAGYPYPPRPGYPFPGQAGSGFQAPIPPEVRQAADAAGLGSPTREYSKGTSSSSAPGLASARFGLGFGLIIGGASVLFAVVIVLLVVPFPLNLYIGIGTLVIVALSILPFIGILGRLTKGLFGGGGSGGLRFWGCPNGLVYMQGRQVSTLRWDDIAQVWRKSAMVNGVLTTIGYAVQPANAQPFEFSMLGGPYAGLMNAFGGAGSVSISSGRSEISNYGGFTQISGYADLSNYAGLGDLIEEQMVARQLPRVRDAYRSGSVISFGQFAVHQQGLSDGTRTLAWSELADMQDSAAAIQITKQPSSLVWFNLPVSSIPNVALLVALLNGIRRGQL